MIDYYFFFFACFLTSTDNSQSHFILLGISFCFNINSNSILLLLILLISCIKTIHDMDSNHNNDRTPSSRWSLRGKKFVVTGGTKGIGKAVVQSLLSHGAYRIVVCSRSDIDYEAYIASVGIDPAQPSSRDTAGGTPVITHVTCDVSTKEGRQKLVNISKDMLNEDLGNDDSDPRCIHGLINNVGINVRKPILEQTEEEYHSMLRTNVDAAYFLCRDFSKHFVDNGDGATIVNVSSAAGVQSSGTGAAYGMSKAALNHFTRILACEWAHRSIRVNAVAPWMTVSIILVVLKQCWVSFFKYFD